MTARAVGLALAMAGALVLLVGCGSEQPAATTVTAPTTVQVPTTQTVPTTVVSTAVTTATESVTAMVTIVRTTTKTAAARVTEEVACQLMLNGGGGEDGAVLRLATLVIDMPATATLDEAADIVVRATSIHDELVELREKAPVDWDPYLTTLIDTSKEIADGMSSGQGVQIDSTTDVRAAGYELAQRCGA